MDTENEVNYANDASVHGATTPDRRITYEELKNHATYSSAWISINGIVYDVTNFVNQHPFGDTFRGNLGTECGGLFSSSHAGVNVEKSISNDKFLQSRGITSVGRLDLAKDYLYKNNTDRFLDRIVYKEMHDDALWTDLRAEVGKYLKENREATHYTPAQGVMYVLYYSSIYVVLSCLAWAEASFLAAIFLGFHMVCAATHMSHLVTHFGFTKSYAINFVAAHFFDLGGLSWLEWQIIHQTHHNQPHSSIDYQTNQYRIRIHKYAERKGHHKYQHIYFWLTVLPYLLVSIPLSTIWLFKNREFVRYKHEMMAHIATRLVLLSQIAYCAYLYGVLIAFTVLLVYSISYSYCAFILLYNDHEDTHNVLALTENINIHHNKLSWAEVQVRTSANWYPTNWWLKFIEFHYGYFNYHIEHHLFPSFKPVLCKKISPIVKRVCEKHGVPYVATTFMEMQKSFQKHIIKMGSS